MVGVFVARHVVVRVRVFIDRIHSSGNLWERCLLFAEFHLLLCGDRLGSLLRGLILITLDGRMALVSTKIAGLCVGVL